MSAIKKNKVVAKKVTYKFYTMKYKLTQGEVMKLLGWAAGVIAVGSAIIYATREKTLEDNVIEASNDARRAIKKGAKKVKRSVQHSVQNSAERIKELMD